METAEHGSTVPHPSSIESKASCKMIGVGLWRSKSVFDIPKSVCSNVNLKYKLRSWVFGSHLVYSLQCDQLFVGF